MKKNPNPARNIVHVLGMLVVALIAANTIWSVRHDRQIILRNAQTQLMDVAVVLAEQTRLGLDAADPAIRAIVKDGNAAHVADPAFQRYFAQRYGALRLGYQGRVLLLRTDGLLLTAYPDAVEAVGRNYSAHPLLPEALKHSEPGVMSGPGVINGDERINAYHTVQGYPLVVAVSASIDALLTEWRGNAARTGVMAALFAAVAIIGTLLLGRQLLITQGLAQSVHENEARLQSIIDSAMDAIITVDERQNIILFNAAAERTFGCSAQAAIGSPLERLMPERYREAHHAHVARFGEAGTTMRRMGGELVLAGLRADGEEFPIDASISHVTVNGRKFYTVILRDITERQRASEALERSHAELQELYEGMHHVREAERTRIARELHDELAQWLTALKMDASWIASRLPDKDDALAKKAERMKGVVDNTVAAMRRIAADLRPVMLDDLGLVPAIEHLLFDLSERTGIVVSLTADADDLNLKEPLSTAVYRMVQEALTNVARHSGARSVEIEIKTIGDRLRVCVRDDGRGMRPDPQRKSFGLIGIRERARTLGGSARIHSPETGGTVVEIEVPIATYLAAE